MAHWLGYNGWWMITHELKPIARFLLLAPLVLGENDRGWLRRLLGLRLDSQV